MPVLGVIENMSTFICPKCSTHSQIFPAGSGGAQAMAREMGKISDQLYHTLIG